MNTNELIESASLKSFLEIRAKLLASFAELQKVAKETAELTDDASRRCNSIRMPAPEIQFVSRNVRERIHNDSALETYTRELDGCLWNALFDRTRVLELMSRERVTEFNQQPQRGEAVPFTAESVIETLRGVYDSRALIMVESIESIFRAQSWDHKTNSPVKIGQKMIVRAEWVSSYGGHLRAFAGKVYLLVSYETKLWFHDFMRVLCLLDGKPVPTTEQSDVTQVVKKEQLRGYSDTRIGLPVGEWHKPHEYFELKAHKNGMAHIRLLRPDLIEKMNLAMSEKYPNALPSEK